MLLSKLSKVLSRNDTGETHSHQSGISIPKDIAYENIFPVLGTETLNPRVTVTFLDENDEIWSFQYIYYNDRFFGKPSSKAHNEYRLTCVKDYINKNSIHSGDTIWFGIDDKKIRRIGFVKNGSEEYQTDEDGNTIINIKGGWRYVKY